MSRFVKGSAASSQQSSVNDSDDEVVSSAEESEEEDEDEEVENDEENDDDGSTEEEKNDEVEEEKENDSDNEEDDDDDNEDDISELNSEVDDEDDNSQSEHASSDSQSKSDHISIDNDDNKSGVVSTKNGEGKNKKDNLLSEDEKNRAKLVFTYCSSHPQKLCIDEEQFNLALTLLGLVEKMEYVRNCFLKEQEEYIDFELFLDLLSELRLKHDVGDMNVSIQNAFDAIYDGTCEFDDQRDEFGRKYIHADELRNLLTTTGLQLSVEEASNLIRETKPKKIRTLDGNTIDIIYFEQYKAMLLDSNA